MTYDQILVSPEHLDELADGLDRTADRLDHGIPLSTADITALRNIGGLLRRHAANAATVRGLLDAVFEGIGQAKP